MTNLKHTKKALLSSIIALVLCFAMLLGTTYAWFTDSATSSGNKIQAGTLDVDLYLWGETGATEITDESDPIFGVNTKALNGTNTLWEPGKTQTVYLSIKNNGSLALKYKVAIEVTEVSTHNLADVMEYAITPDAHYGQDDVTAWAGNGTKVENAPGINATNYKDVELAPGAEHFFALSIHMDELATNEYMGESITFDIRVLAGQLASESDSFGNSYDKFAGYPGKGYAAPIDKANNQSAAEIQITGDDGYKVGSFVIPADAAEDGADLSATVEKSAYKANITVATNSETIAYDITVDGLKDGNTEPVKVQLKLPAGLDPDTVKVYHYDTEIGSTYNPNTGYVTFETATFSPFTLEFDAESVYTPVLPEGATTPVAKVTYEAQYVNTELPWGSYGQWSPTEGLDSNLEAAFTFACPDYDEATEAEKEIIDAYRYWYCDFYVSLDKELGANQIFLGGNYGSFGWVGFHNGELTLAANEEIALLSSVTTNPWTYDDVENNVGEFICGVGDVDDALDDATFTVKLRLIDPEKVDTSVEGWWANLSEDAYIDVNVVNYTFGGSYTIDGVAPQAAE